MKNKLFKFTITGLFVAQNKEDAYAQFGDDVRDIGMVENADCEEITEPEEMEKYGFSEKDLVEENGCLHNFQDNICKTCGVVAETDTDGNRVADDY